MSSIIFGRIRVVRLIVILLCVVPALYLLLTWLSENNDLRGRSGSAHARSGFAVPLLVEGESSSGSNKLKYLCLIIIYA